MLSQHLCPVAYKLQRSRNSIEEDNARPAGLDCELQGPLSSLHSFLLSVYKGVNYGPVIKSSAKLLPHSLFHSPSVSTLVFSVLASGRPPATLPHLLPQRRHRTLARLHVELTVTACTVGASEAHTLSSLLTAQNRLADKTSSRSERASRRRCVLRAGVFLVEPCGTKRRALLLCTCDLSSADLFLAAFSQASVKHRVK